MSESDNSPDPTIALAEEMLSVRKQRIETARVKVRVRTKSDTVNHQVSLFDQNVEVERVPIGREVTETPQIREEGDVTIIPILEEILVVEKRLFLKEEVHVRRVVTRTDQSQPVTLRSQWAEIERTPVTDKETNSTQE